MLDKVQLLCKTTIALIQFHGLFKSLIFVLGFIALLLSFLVYVAPEFFKQFEYQRKILLEGRLSPVGSSDRVATPVPVKSLEGKRVKVTDNSMKTKTGDINISGNSAPAQVMIGSPGGQQIINQERGFEPQAKIAKSRRGNLYVLHVALNQTSGLWNQGAEFKVQVKVSGPYESANIIQGLPPARFNVMIGGVKEQGDYSFSTSTAPFPDQQVVLEIVSKEEVNLLGLAVAPLAQSK